MIPRTNALLALSPTADQTNKEGCFVELSNGNVAICNAAADIPFGLIVDGAPTSGKSSVAVCAGGYSGTVKVKVAATSPGTINLGTMLTLTADGSVKADAGSGARVQVAQALEAGAADELIEAVLIRPTALS